MCGIVTFWGQERGVSHVLEALHLLQYRAPDSSGVAAVRADGTIAIRRTVGPPRQLIREMATNPLYTVPSASDAARSTLLQRQGLPANLSDLENCSSVDAGRLYDTPPVQIGIGQYGPLDLDSNGNGQQLSRQMQRALRTADASLAPDYVEDAVSHAFRLVGTHVATRVTLDERLKQQLDMALAGRLPHAGYTCWREAWDEEVACNLPGHAFAVAVRHFQETFPGLAEQVQSTAWERVGGLTARAMSQMVMGHGRWAMVGAVSQSNAHPFPDRSLTRLVCENGSHNARVMLGLRAEQEAWWRAQGIAADEAVHRSENTTEVIAYEWERVRHQLEAGEQPRGSASFLSRLDQWEVEEMEERALRLALWRMREGNAHACAFYSRQQPGTLYVSSHHKPIAIVSRTIQSEDRLPRRELMVASDINAGLMLWPGAEVDAAAAALHRLGGTKSRDSGDAAAKHIEAEKILERFAVDVIFLDADLFQGEELLASISNRVEEGQIIPQVEVTRYDGTPLSVKAQRIHLNPAMVGKGTYDSYTESHIAEIPGVADGIVGAYVADTQVQLDSAWEGEQLLWPGLNVSRLQERFGSDLGGLQRILLAGEGSSWRDAQVAAPLLRQLLPGVAVNVYHPVELLNLGKVLDPQHDLAVEISWSGTTDSLLKVDAWLAEVDLLRIAVTGRAQSDLGRRAAMSGGTLDVRSGVEVSVATVKGFQAILMTLDLFGLQLAALRPHADETGEVPAHRALVDELSLVMPRHLRALVENEERRARIRQVAQRCRHFNKVAVVGHSPIELEGELKIEELAQIVAVALDFHDSSLRPLMERSALVEEDVSRTLFIFNTTSPDAHAEARPLIDYLDSIGLSCIVHSTPHEQVREWQAMKNIAVFITPQVSPWLQPLLDAPFFFDLAVALAYARGLSPAEIDSPRNLAKSVTTTGAERRTTVEARPELANVTREEFAASDRAAIAWDVNADGPSRTAFRATVALRAALSVVGKPLPPRLALNHQRHLLLITDTEATENAGLMAATAWQELLDIDLAVYRRFLSSLFEPPAATIWLRLVRAGVVLSLRDDHTITLPADMSPLQLELLGAFYLTGLAVRLAQRRGQPVDAWETGLAQLPLLIAEVMADRTLAASVRRALAPYLARSYDKFQIIGGGQDYAAAASIARSLRMQGFMAEELYTDSAWHGPLATVGGPDAHHDTLILILATDPLFQAAALVDTQVYRTRNAPVFLLVPAGNEEHPAVQGVQASAVLSLPGTPRLFLPLVNAAFGAVLARQVARLSHGVEG